MADTVDTANDAPEPDAIARPVATTATPAVMVPAPAAIVRLTPDTVAAPADDPVAPLLSSAWPTPEADAAPIEMPAALAMVADAADAVALPAAPPAAGVIPRPTPDADAALVLVPADAAMTAPGADVVATPADEPVPAATLEDAPLTVADPDALPAPADTVGSAPTPDDVALPVAEPDAAANVRPAPDAVATPADAPAPALMLRPAPVAVAVPADTPAPESPPPPPALGRSARVSAVAAFDTESVPLLIVNAAGLNAPDDQAALPAPIDTDRTPPEANALVRKLLKPVVAMVPMAAVVTPPTPAPKATMIAPLVTGVIAGGSGAQPLILVAVVAAVSNGVVASTPRQTWIATTPQSPALPDALRLTVLSGVLPISFQLTDMVESRVSAAFSSAISA
ncbi:hypothetical protein [Blastomonas sp.]|uniref:hypothetical protein n=1 Tax=Blastomonas sp. TaxID=1909299 RepID=UPI00258FC872|nr:hypothetical protein [Blastomonas sp.]